jgi:hypothetical protein
MPPAASSASSANLDDLQRQALVIRDLYGDLAKLAMAADGARDMPGGHAALGHELADCLWCVLVLAHLHQVDLAAEFDRTMHELDAVIRAQLAAHGETSGDDGQ